MTAKVRTASMISGRRFFPADWQSLEQEQEAHRYFEYEDRREVGRPKNPDEVRKNDEDEGVYCDQQ